MKADGGYYLIRRPLITSPLYAHTSRDPGHISPLHLDSLNRLQATAWRVNQWLLDILDDAWQSDMILEGLPDPSDVPLPERLPDEVWDTMTPAERGEVKATLESAHDENARRYTKRLAYLRRASLAREFEARESIWFPHNLDFRGRMYPVSDPILSPQGDDVSKGLLMFSEGKPLGSSGVWWLAVHLANLWGEDKLPYRDRVAWTLDHEARIIEAAANPLDGTRWWTEADSPWSFLAACREWALSLEGQTCQEDFHSHLPIHLDGSCNGLQHLSLMLRDVEGLTATNCLPADRPADIYSEVADLVLASTQYDASAGNEIALAWLRDGKVDRNLCKRSVMTTPYAVTPNGIRRFMVVDGHTAPLSVDRNAAAAYMQQQITNAVSSKVVASREVMTFFQQLAEAAAEVNEAVAWRTPSGNTIVQRYSVLTERRISVLGMRLSLWGEAKEDLGITLRRQIQGISPNIVHSFDAAMAALVIQEMAARVGTIPITMVHDSYGVHACDTGTLSRVTRDVALEIYQTDWLASIRRDIAEFAPRANLPDPPPRRDFDLSPLREAEYFFG